MGIGLSSMVLQSDRIVDAAFSGSITEIMPNTLSAHGWTFQGSCYIFYTRTSLLITHTVIGSGCCSYDLKQKPSVYCTLQLNISSIEPSRATDPLVNIFLIWFKISQSCYNFSKSPRLLIPWEVGLTLVPVRQFPSSQIFTVNVSQVQVQSKRKSAKT